MMPPRLILTFFVQIPPLGSETPRGLGDFDYSNEMKAMGSNLDMLKGRAQDVITAYRHSLSKGAEVFDPAVNRRFLESFSLSNFFLCFPRLRTNLRSCLKITRRKSMMLRKGSTPSENWSGSPAQMRWDCIYMTRV